MMDHLIDAFVESVQNRSQSKHTGNITSSGGSTLTLFLIIYNNDRLDWNMSINNININQFYYLNMP